MGPNPVELCILSIYLVDWINILPYVYKYAGNNEKVNIHSLKCWEMFL